MPINLVQRATELRLALARALPPMRRLLDERAMLRAELASVQAMSADMQARLDRAEADRHEGTSESAAAAPASAGQHIRIEYPIAPRHRLLAGTPGGDALWALISAGDQSYERFLRRSLQAAEQLSAIGIEAPDDPTQPYWDNGWLPPLDGLVLTQLLLDLRPATYLEIGSGNSTRFARRAIEQAGLPTRIVSIDPEPRAEIDRLCDQVIRSGLQSAGVRDSFDGLAPGDLVFFDGSHYCFQNSDVAVFFTELLHAIPPGSVYGIHDIFLPHDYPDAWLDRYYNEQYVLAAWLLGGAGGDDIVLPAAYVSYEPSFTGAVDALIARSGAGPERHGGAFWMRRSMPTSEP